MSKHIQVMKEERVVTITIVRADKKNAITQAMYGAMADALNNYGNDNATRALIITGQGDIFTAGNDLQDFSLGGDEKIPPVVSFLTAIRDCPKPVIACVNGAAIGVGLTMLLHCDLVYAGENATFSAPFAKLALVPEAGSSMLLPAAVGMAVCNDILLAGRTLNADEALRFGLIARVFSDTELAKAVSKIAVDVASWAPNAMRQSKALIRNQRDQISDHMAIEVDRFTTQLKSKEFSETISAIIEKRPPTYG